MALSHTVAFSVSRSAIYSADRTSFARKPPAFEKIDYSSRALFAGRLNWGTFRKGVAASLCGTVVLFATGCALTWKGGDGAMRTVGCFRYEIQDCTDGRIVERQSLGLDLNFGGVDRTCTLGFKSTREMAPRVIVTSRTDLGSQLIGYLTQLEREGIRPVQKRRSGFCYLRSAPDFSPTILSTIYAGLHAARRTDHEFVLSMGVGKSVYYGETLFTAGNVQLLSRGPGGRIALVLWRLADTPSTTSTELQYFFHSL